MKYNTPGMSKAKRKSVSYDVEKSFYEGHSLLNDSVSKILIAFKILLVCHLTSSL